MFRHLTSIVILLSTQASALASISTDQNQSRIGVSWELHRIDFANASTGMESETVSETWSLENRGDFGWLLTSPRGENEVHSLSSSSDFHTLPSKIIMTPNALIDLIGLPEDVQPNNATPLILDTENSRASHIKFIRKNSGGKLNLKIYFERL